MLTKESIVRLLKEDDRAVVRALIVLNERQTVTEQAAESTINRNGMGFRPAHARMGTSMASFFKLKGYLTPKQIAYWRAHQRDGRMRIEIYAGQLLEAAKLKAAGAAQVAITQPTKVEQKPNPYIGCDVGNLMEERMVLDEQLSAYQEGAMGEGAEQDKAMEELTQRIRNIDLAVQAMRAEEDMHRMEAQADREETAQNEYDKFMARCRMERK